MVRKQIYLERRQDEALKRRAEETGVSESALIRDYIDSGMHQPAADERDRIWQEEMARMERFAAEHAGTPQSKRTWTREDLYEERFARYSR